LVRFLLLSRVVIVPGNTAMIRFKRGIQARLSGHPLRGLALSLFLPSSDHVLLKAVPSRPFNKEELQAFRDHEVLSVTDDS
jgi:hypothetical protein